VLQTDGFRIAQVSDLHNAEFGEDNKTLIALLSRTEPDIIVLTGDLIDSRQTDIDIALDFVRQAMEIAPVYYVSGNHESRVGEYVLLKAGMEEIGVAVLENRKVQIIREGEHVTLMGIDDPSFRAGYLFGDAASIAQQEIENQCSDSDGYTILLSHRPELFDLYVDTGMDLVFSGHAHGGQFRLPFLGGLVAPNQGFFPRYDAGRFTNENTTMIVSRGVGNSIFPIRFNNRPEIVLVTLGNSK
jgi:predicted MPP superfamily phosphohydrolase